MYNEYKQTYGELLLLNNQHDTSAEYNKATIDLFKSIEDYAPRFIWLLLKLDAAFIEAKEARQRNDNDEQRTAINARIDHLTIKIQDYLFDLENNETSND